MGRTGNGIGACGRLYLKTLLEDNLRSADCSVKNRHLVNRVLHDSATFASHAETGCKALNHRKIITFARYRVRVRIRIWFRVRFRIRVHSLPDINEGIGLTLITGNELEYGISLLGTFVLKNLHLHCAASLSIEPVNLDP